MVASLYNYTVLQSDAMFNYAIDRAARLHASRSSGKTFYYKFSFNGSLNVVKLATRARTLGFPGATHGDDRYYVLGLVFSFIALSCCSETFFFFFTLYRSPDGMGDALYSNIFPDSTERKCVKEFATLFANFIIYG